MSIRDLFTVTTGIGCGIVGWSFAEGLSINPYWAAAAWGGVGIALFRLLSSK